MKAQNTLFALFLGFAVTLTSFCSETPQLGYWQQFKNWVTGTTAQAQAITSVSYEWAKDFVAGLTPVQKEALKGVLIGLAGGAIGEKLRTGEITAYGTIGTGLTTGAAIGLTKKYVVPHIDAYFALKNEVEQMKKGLEGLSKEQKIAQLQQMRNNYSLESKNPDELKLNAIDVILVELSKE